MKRNIALIGLFLIAAICLVTFGGKTNPISKVTCTNEKTLPVDTGENNTIQALLDKYNSLINTKDVINRKITSAKDFDFKERFDQLNNEKEFYTKKIESIKRIDTLKSNIDASEYFEAKKGIYLNGLLELNEKVINQLYFKEKRNKIYIDSLEKEKANLTEPIENIKKNIRAESSKMINSYQLNFCGIKYNIFIADIDSNIIQMHLYNGEGRNLLNLGAVKKTIQGQKLKPLMITNAGMFTERLEPEGLFIGGNQKKIFELDTGKNNPELNFYMKPNGVFYIDSQNYANICTTESFIDLMKKKKTKVKIATQSGPMLLIDGDLHPKFKEGSKNYNIRSGVGIINEKKIVFAISLGEVNFYDFAMFFKIIFNCKNALYLDGAISKMYLYDIAPNTTDGRFGPMISVSRKN